MIKFRGEINTKIRIFFWEKIKENSYYNMFIPKLSIIRQNLLIINITYCSLHHVQSLSRRISHREALCV